MKTILVLIFAISGLAQAQNYDLQVKINRAVVSTSGLLGVNLLQGQRETGYEGKSPNGRPCYLLATLIPTNSGKAVAGLTVKMGSPQIGQLLIFTLAFSHSTSADITQSFGKFNLYTTYGNDQTRSTDTMSLQVQTAYGSQTITLTENGQSLTCSGFKFNTQEVE